MKPLSHKNRLCLLALCCVPLVPSCQVISSVVHGRPTVIHALPDQDEMASPLSDNAVSLAGDISFSSSRFTLSESQQNRLQKHAEEWKAAGKHLVIAGFASSDTLPDHARALSQRRAEAVRAALIAAGLDASLLHATGYGNDIATAKADDVVRIYGGK